MSFNRESLALISGAGGNSVYAYNTQDGSLDVKADGYFNDASGILDPTSMIMCQTKYGSLLLYVSTIVNGVVSVSGSNRPVLEGTIDANNAITQLEIEGILTSYGINVPLTSDSALYMRDPDARQDKAFLVKFSESADTWYYEKLNPASVTVAQATSDDNLVVAVGHQNKITVAEIEQAIDDAGFELPTRSVTLYIEDSNRDNVMYLCRHDSDADGWFCEKLSKAN